MAGEVGEAAQVMSVGVNGATVAMKGTKTLIENLVKLIWFILKNTAFKDKARFMEFMKAPGQKVFCEFKDKDRIAVEEQLKAMKVPYVILPDMDADDGKFTAWVAETDHNILKKLENDFVMKKYKDFNEYLAVHPEWDEALEEQTTYLNGLPIVGVANAIKESDGITQEDLISKFGGKYTPEQIANTVELVNTHGIVEINKDGKMVAGSNFQEALDSVRTRADSAVALTKGRVLMEDDRFIGVSIKKSLILTESNLSDELKKSTKFMDEFNKKKESHVPYVLSGDSKHFVWIPKNNVCAEIEKGMANEVYLNKMDSYTVFNKETGKAEGKKIGSAIQSDNFKDRLYESKVKVELNNKKKKNKNKFFFKKPKQSSPRSR